MKSVLLRLEGPLQAWGTQGRFSIRDTEAEPSKSGVLGLVGAALGMSRDDDAQLSALAGLRMATRVDREGVPLRDYHTAGGGRFRGVDFEVNGAAGTVLTDRHYLADASFLVALGGDDAVVERVAAALRNPVWPLFLGRKACVPSTPIFEGVFDGAPEEAVKRHPLRAEAGRAADEREAASPKLRLVLEAAPELPGARPRSDVPVSFRLYARQHARRFVTTDWVSARDLRGGDQ